MSETPKIENDEVKDVDVPSERQNEEAMAAQPAKTEETANQSDKYARLKQRFTALKKVGDPAAKFHANLVGLLFMLLDKINFFKLA